MPGNIQAAAPIAVLPKNLATAFVRQMDFQANVNVYKSGEYQSALLVENPRRQWTLTRRLTPSATAALQAFYTARHGGGESFWFYDPFEPATGQPINSNWDAAGAVTDGRYCVRFDGGYTQTQGKPGRINHDFTLTELTDGGRGATGINATGLTITVKFAFRSGGTAEAWFSLWGRAFAIGELPFYNDGTNYVTPQTRTFDIWASVNAFAPSWLASPSALFNLPAYFYIVRAAGTEDSELDIYAAHLTATWSNGNISTLRPGTVATEPQGNWSGPGNFVNPAFAIDGDAATFAAIHSNTWTSFTTHGDSLVLREFA